MQAFLLGLFIFSIIAYLLLVIYSYIGANYYDLKQMKRLRQPAPSTSRQPLLSVIISTKNNEADIIYVLEGVKSSTYKNKEVLIIDHNSRDKTKQLIRGFMKNNRDLNIKLIARRTNKNPQQAVQTSIYQHANGAYITFMEADCYLNPQTYEKAMEHLIRDKSIDVLQPQLKNLSEYTLTSLIQTYQTFQNVRYQKFYSLVGLTLIDKAAIYSRRGYRRLVNEQLPENFVYASNACVFIKSEENLLRLIIKEGQQMKNRLALGFKSPLHWIFMGVTVITQTFMPFIVAYSIYLALSLSQPALLIVICAVAAIFTLSAVWDDNLQTWPEKVIYSLGVPITFAIFYIMSIGRLWQTIKPVIWPYFMANDYLKQSLKSPQLT